jgi:hypothetical protein
VAAGPARGAPRQADRPAAQAAVAVSTTAPVTRASALGHSTPPAPAFRRNT